MRQRKNNVFVVSAPSGAGKSSLIQLLLAQLPGLHFSISHTTRPPREGEMDGVEYFFIDQTKFQNMIDHDEFLEWAEVHGYFYGTSRQNVQLAESEGKDLLLDIDVQGAEKIRALLLDAVTVFIMPPSYETLRERLIRRQKDTENQIVKRLENARKEIQHYANYHYVVVNDDLSSASENLISIVRSQRCHRDLLQSRINDILKSFDPS